MERFKINFAVYIILEKDNQICLLKRQNTGFMDGYYSLVSGHVDGKEAATLAALREVWEEVGVRIDKEDLEHVHTLHRKSAGDNEYIDLFFQCSAWAGEVINKETDKCSSVCFVEKNNLPNNLIPYLKDVLKEIWQGKTYSEINW